MHRLLMPVLLGLMSLPAGAATFVVTSLNDEGPGSLRAAIVAANAAGAAGAPHRIEFAASYPLNGEIELFNPLPGINVVAEIDGNGRAPVLRSFDPTQDLRLMETSASLTLRRIELHQGRTTGRGGCLANMGGSGNATLLLDRVRFSGCLAAGAGTTRGEGGAVSWLSTGSVGVFESVFENNAAAHPTTGAGVGGALWVTGPLLVQSSRFFSNLSNGSSTRGAAIAWYGAVASTLEIRDSVFAGNIALPEAGAGNTGLGGAVVADCPTCSVHVVRSYFGSNRSSAGGALFLRGNSGANSMEVVIENSSFVDNSATADGGALNFLNARVFARHLSFFDNAASGLGSHLTTSFTELVEWVNSAMGPKRVGAGNACAISTAAANTTGTLLDTGDTTCRLGLPGTPTGVSLQVLGVDDTPPMPVLVFDPASLAVDGADAARCLPTDARGVARPQDGNGDGLARCDVGAFELQAAELFADGFED